MSLALMMAGLGMAFNAAEHNERTHRRLLPAGWYKVQIVNSEIKPTKTPGGARLNLQFKILEGDFVGQVIFGGYNVQNANPVAVQIAMEELAELSRAVGVPVWQDTNQLHAIPFNLKVKVRVQDGYDPNNEPEIYQHLTNIDGVKYATKADLASLDNLPKSKPATNAGAGVFGAATNQPQQQQGFGQPQQGFNQQPQQQTQTGFNQPVQQPQQQPQQNPGAVNFNQAAQNQPWNNANQQSQPQQQPAQATQQQPVQQEPQQQQTVATSQPTWAQQQIQPGAEQPAQQQQTQQQQPVQEPQDAIAQAAQTTVPPWKREAAQ